MEPGHAAYKATALKVVISASLATSVMLLDLAYLMRDEIKYVWPWIRSSWTARIYISARYIGLMSQLFNVYFAVRMYLGMYTSPTGCRVWFAYQAFLIQLLLGSLEGILMHRIYRLFLRSQMILMMLISFVLAQIASMIASASLGFDKNKYTASCWVVKTSHGNAFFSATTMATTVIIFFMTFWRYFQLPTKWTREGVGRVVIRDSAYSLAAISVIMLFLTLCSLEIIKPSMSGNITFAWLVCTLWISIGHVIVNHERIPRDERGVSSTWKATVQLTSQIEMGESVLTLDTQCPSSDMRTGSTLQGSFTPVTKASERLPSSACASSGPREWYGDVPLSHGQVGARTSTLSVNASSVPGSTSSERTGEGEEGLRANGCEEHGQRPCSSLRPSGTGSVEAGGASQTEDADAHRPSPRSSPRPSPGPSPRSSCPELPPTPPPLETSAS